MHSGVLYKFFISKARRTVSACVKISCPSRASAGVGGYSPIHAVVCAPIPGQTVVQVESRNGQVCPFESRNGQVCPVKLHRRPCRLSHCALPPCRLSRCALPPCRLPPCRMSGCELCGADCGGLTIDAHSEAVGHAGERRARRAPFPYMRATCTLARDIIFYSTIECYKTCERRQKRDIQSLPRARVSRVFILK